MFLVNRLFHTPVWKVIAFLFLIALSVFALRAALVMPGFPWSDSTAVRGQELEGIIDQGRIALFGLIIVAIAAFFDLIDFFERSQGYRSVVRAMRRFQGGEHDLRAPTFRSPEVNRLGEAFNAMANSIVKNIEELKETNNLRRELVANIAHDLGGPLTSIQGFVETMLSKGQHLSEDEMRHILEVVLSNVKSLSYLVNELMELSRLDAITETASFQSFSIYTLAIDVASRFVPIAEKKKISVIVPDSLDLPLVYGDVSLIERVLSNILSNSVRFTPDGGEVRFDFIKSNANVHIRISDTGIGIPADAVNRVFDRFFRVEKDRSRSSGGAGIGLAIVKRILDIHGSKISLMSAAGEGTTIEFTLPYAN